MKETFKLGISLFDIPPLLKDIKEWVENTVAGKDCTCGNCHEGYAILKRIDKALNEVS
jgi:hypothetical protein